MKTKVFDSVRLFITNETMKSIFRSFFRFVFGGGNEAHVDPAGPRTLVHYQLYSEEIRTSN